MYMDYVPTQETAVPARQTAGHEGFTTNQRSFGSIDYYPVTVNGYKAAIIIPERTTHAVDIVEILT
jgi:CTP-dependent riboflavin kinase